MTSLLLNKNAIALYGHYVAREPFIKPNPNAPGDSSDASLIYFAIALVFAAIEPGIFSLDCLLFGYFSSGGE